MGKPQEWFNPEILPHILGRFPECDFETYCDLLQRRFKTPNGVFGIEVSFFQMELAERLAPVTKLFGDELRYIYLTRRDFVAQGISLYKAVTTGHFQSVKEKSEETKENLENINYDKEKIKEWTMHNLQQELGFEKMFKKQRLSPLRISYESLCEDSEGVVGNIADYLEISGSVIIRDRKVRHKKVSDEKNVLWKERFLSDEKKFVDFWEKNRGRKAAF